MKYYAQFDKDGFPLGFWNEEVYPPTVRKNPETDEVVFTAPNEAIPKDAVEITVQQWKAFIDNSGLRKWENGHVVPYAHPGPSLEQQWDHFRRERDNRISETDWIVIKSLETGEDVPKAWTDYRQALRDMPKTTEDPLKPSWPNKPE